MIKRSMLMLLGAAVLFSCSDDGNIQEELIPQLSIEGTEGSINLQLPRTDDRPAKQANSVIIRNTGQAPLSITNLEWLAKPTRVDAIGASGSECTDDSQCGGGEACLAPTCVSLGFAQTPIEVEPGLRYDLEFLVTTGSGELDCPAAPEGTPEEFLNSFCGAFQISTNAINSGGLVENGSATIYLLRPSSSGQIEITPDFVEFQLVQPGVPQTRDVSVRNVGSETLTVTEIFIASMREFVSVGGETPPVEIEPGTSNTWTVTVSVPEGTDPSEYEGFTELTVNSTAVNNLSGGKIPVQISAGAASAPLISVDPTTLTFDQADRQTITISNDGDATLQVTSLTVTPASTRAFYKWEVDGTDVTNNFQTINVPKGETKDIVVVFERPAGNEDSAVATLQINHNDRISNSRTEVTLLGDAGDVPIARIYPTGFTFQAAQGEISTRTFVIRNVGTADLEITDEDLQFSVGDESGAEFQVSGHLGTIAPGGLRSGTVTFTGANATEDIGVVIFESNDPNTSIELGIKDVVAAAAPVSAVITPASLNDGKVGVVASFSANESTPAQAITNALWTLTSRPAGSNVFFSATGAEMQFVPDVAGEYTFSMLLSSELRESEATFTLNVVP